MAHVLMFLERKTIMLNVSHLGNECNVVEMCLPNDMPRTNKWRYTNALCAGDNLASSPELGSFRILIWMLDLLELIVELLLRGHFPCGGKKIDFDTRDVRRGRQGCRVQDK